MTADRPVSGVPIAAARMPGARACQARRERGTGVGYGRSSGYAAPRRYAPNAALPRFRFI